MTNQSSKKQGKQAEKPAQHKSQDSKKSTESKPKQTSKGDSALVSFPPYPDTEPEEEEDDEEDIAPPPEDKTKTHRPSFSDRLSSGVLSLFRTNDAGESGSEAKKPVEKNPQPPRTGVSLYCKHAFEDPCRCRKLLQPEAKGDYCSTCWAGKCPGPVPAGSPSAPKTSRWSL